MRHAAKTMFPFGVYLIFIGFMFLLFPEIMLLLAGVQTPPDVMSRIFGMIILFLAFYYIKIALHDENMEVFFQATVYTRGSAIIFLTVFMLFGWANPLAVIFGVVDLAGAIWTWVALKKDKSDMSKK